MNSLSLEQLRSRTSMMENNIRIMNQELLGLNHQLEARKHELKDLQSKVKMHKQLPYLVSNVIEILDLEPEPEEDGAVVDLNAQRTEKCVVVKTSARQTVFLPVVGLVDAATLKPGDLVGVNKDSFLILDTLPPEYDNRVKVRLPMISLARPDPAVLLCPAALPPCTEPPRAKLTSLCLCRPDCVCAQAMEVDEKPTDSYLDIGGLDKQIEELKEAVVYPMTHKHLYDSIGIRAPKGPTRRIRALACLPLETYVPPSY